MYRTVLIIFLVAVFYIFFFSGLLAVTKIEIQGTSEIVQEDLKKTIEERISRKYFDSISANNIALIKKNLLKKELKDSFRGIEDIKIVKVFPDTLLFTVYERRPGLVFGSGERYFMVDKKGYVYDDNVSDSTREKYPVLTDLSASSVNLEENIIKEGYISYVTSIREKIKSSLGIDIENCVETPSIVSSDIRIRTQEGWRIFFSIDIELDKEIKMLEAVLSNNIDPAQRSNLEYIDLRVDNKVFYKFREGAQQEKETKVEGAEAEREEEKKTEEGKKEEKKKKKK